MGLARVFGNGTDQYRDGRLVKPKITLPGLSLFGYVLSVTAHKAIKLCVLVLIGVFALSGCGVAYQQQRSEILRTASAEDFGPPPPEDYRARGEDFIRRRLKDPESARFEWVGEPRHEAIQPALASPHARPVWVTVVRVNAKNSFGGYTGASPFVLAWSHGRIVAYTSTETGYWEYVQVSGPALACC